MRHAHQRGEQVLPGFGARVATLETLEGDEVLLVCGERGRIVRGGGRVILAEPDTRERFAGFGGAPAYSTPEAMRARVENEVARWKKVVETRGIERQ